MAGTKEKPCSLCHWNRFSLWLSAMKAGQDHCLECVDASEWAPKEPDQNAA
ncbi:MAG: hypothetical protein Q8P24_02495 [Desulfobacterales bacterium]|nr:hypothetical protein [Desulfobacterales bacterium]